MAEFTEVMKQWGRMCEAHCKVHNDDCDGCLLGGTRADLCAAYAKDTAEDADDIERLVMKWAAEHPEPVYPTWKEYLEGIHVIGNTCTPTTRMYTPIPANIAQKLGIEPKEG